MKNLKSTIITSIINTIILLIISSWITMFAYPIVPYLLLAGSFLVWTQRETKTKKFLSKLAIGSVLTGIMFWFLSFLKMYILSNLIYDTFMPFSVVWDVNYIVLGVIMIFTLFVGGLVGVVLKGLHELYKNELNKVIIIFGPLLSYLSTLFYYKTKIGGTILSARHGWPYPLWTHQIKDIVDGFTMDTWTFYPGRIYQYVIINYLFFLVIFILAFYLVDLINQKLNKKINQSKFLFGLLLIITLTSVSFLPAKRSYIDRQIAKAGTCEKEADCAIISNKYPFSCAVVVNKNYSDKILKLINSYPETGELHCSGKEKATCIKNKCSIAFDHTSNDTYWNILKEAIANCRVASIAQAHNLEVRAILKSGKIIEVIESEIDEVFDIVQQYEDKCGRIEMMTE